MVFPLAYPLAISTRETRKDHTMKAHHVLGIIVNLGAPSPSFPPPTRISDPLHGPFRGLTTETQKPPELMGSVRNQNTQDTLKSRREVGQELRRGAQRREQTLL